MKRLWNWWVDGFIGNPFMWSIGTIVVLGIFVSGIKCAFGVSGPGPG